MRRDVWTCEFRIKLRSAPRLRVEQVFTRNEDTKARLFNDEYGAIRRRWGVPIWSQAQFVGSLSSGATSVNCDTDVYEFVDTSLALVWQSVDQFEVVEIDVVGSGALTLVAALSASYAFAYVMPLRVGFVDDSIDMMRTGANDVVKISYDVEDNVVLATSAPTQYLGQDIYYEAVLKNGESYDLQILANEDVADYQLGRLDRKAPWTYTRQLSNYQRLLKNPIEVYGFKQWMHRRAGKYRAFWLPSFENDVRVKNAGSITTTLQWHRDSYDEWATDRTHIAVEDTSGVWYPRTLSAVSVVDATTLQGTLSSSLGGLTAATIRRISYLGLKRLATDQMKLEWLGNSVARCNFSVLELSP